MPFSRERTGFLSFRSKERKGTKKQKQNKTKNK